MASISLHKSFNGHWSRALQSSKRVFSAFGIALFAAFNLLSAQVNPNYHYVKPHYRSDGTYVEGHYRTNRNNTNRDNYSTLGNTNPWTGKAGWIPPDDNPTRSGTITWDNSKSSSRGSSAEARPSQVYVPPARPTAPSYVPSYTPGPRRITYRDGEEEIFSVASSQGVKFEPDKTYWSFDPSTNSIETTKGYSDGLLLHGKYRQLKKDGSLIMVAEYQNGLENGDLFIFDDFGVVKKSCKYVHGELVYWKSFEPDGKIHEVIGRSGQVGTIKREIYNGKVIASTTYQPESIILRTSYNEYSGKKEFELRYHEDGSFAEATAYHPDGISKKRTATFVNWEKSGKQLEYDENGTQASLHTYQNDMLNGPFEYYHPNGKISESGTYRYNSLEGVAQSFDLNGLPLRKMNFDNGLLDGAYEEFESGRVTLRGSYADGEKTGLWERLMPDKTEESMVTYEFHHYAKGQLHGRFKEVRWDSIVVGNYQEGQLDGEYLVYQPQTKFWLGDEPQESDLTVKGKYFKGLRTSNWQFFYRGGGLLMSGDYVLDKQHGTWKHYLPVINDGEYQGQGFNGQLMRQEEYYHGVLHGTSASYYRIHSEPVPCPGNDLREDSCFHYRLEKLDSKFSYHLGKLSGPFTIRDSLGRMMEEGAYLEDELHGKWTENAFGLSGQKVFSREINYNQGKQDGRNMFWDKNGLLRREAWFKDDERVGTWKYFREASTSLLMTETYHDEGFDVVYYATTDNPKLVAKYRDGHFSSITAYDSISRSNIKYHCALDECHESVLGFTMTSQSGDTTFTIDYQLINSDCDFFYGNPLALASAISKSLKAKEGNLIYHGDFSASLSNGTVLQKGKYKAGLKIGTWEYRHPSDELTQHVIFIDGIPKGEEFIDSRTSSPFNGTARFNSFDGQYQIAKIRKGKRDGLTKTFDEKGNLVRRVQYDEGVESTSKPPAP